MFQLNHGDSKDFIKTIPDKSVDLIFTDPPYNIGQLNNKDIFFKGKKYINLTIAEWDKQIFDPSEWVEEFVRILSPKGNIFIFAGHNQFGQWHTLFEKHIQRNTYFVWKKTNPTPQIRKKSFLMSTELIICAWNSPHTFNFSKQKEMHNFFESPICMGNERLKQPHHPTQKPLKLCKRIIEIASNEGDTVFDPFMGVGSIGVAALELGRNFIGSELDEQYFNAAKERMKVNLKIDFNE